VTQQEYEKKPGLPPGSILYFVRLVIVSLATIGVAIEPHTFQGHGYSSVDYTLLFIPFFFYIVQIVTLFKRGSLFFYVTHLLFGVNLTLFVLTLTPYFIEENTILPFLCVIDFLMVLYLHKSVHAAIFYRYRKIYVAPAPQENT